VKVILESTPRLKGRILEGTALTPAVSLNGNIYSAEEIDNAKNLGVPLKADWEHTEEIIGSVIFSSNPSNHSLDYKITVESATRAAEIAQNPGMYKVSIEANVGEVIESCSKKRCYNLVSDISMEGIAVTKNPSVQTTSLKVIESFQDWEPISINHKHNTSLSVNESNQESMTCDCEKHKTSEMDHDGECPDGQAMKDGKCVPKESKEAAEPPTVIQNEPGVDACPEGSIRDTTTGKCVPEANQAGGAGGSGTFDTKTESGHGMPNMDVLAEIQKQLKEQKDYIKDVINNQKGIAELDQMIAQGAKKSIYSTTRISPQGGRFANEDFKYLAQEARQSIKKFGKYAWEVDLSEEYTNAVLEKQNQVKEALTFSGDQSNKGAVTTGVSVLPGGKYIKSIRDLVLFDEFPSGNDLLKRYRGDIPNNQTITEGSTFTPNAHTITTVTLAADTVTGNGDVLTKAQFEDSPMEIMSYLTQAARAEVLESEATLVFTTAAAAATPGLWINANSGATITHTDIASMTQTPTSVAVALQHYETQGYDTSFGNIYYVLHPKALRELRTSTLLTTLVQQGDANITKTGRLTHLYGIELIPSTALDTDDNTTNDVYNNVFGVKKHTFWLGSHRDLTVALEERADTVDMYYNWTQRKNATTFDATSFVRCSSAQA